ncbi:MAG TPA: hypothetical protein DFS52_23375 [Myxococcales bacterium]|nr:hypothetical protein [Myxococcales bacterium]
MVISLKRARNRLHVKLEDRARLAFINKDYALALRAAQGAVRCRPDCSHGRILLGDVLCALGMEAAALKAYHQARRLAPERSEPYWAISSIHLLAGRWRDALRYLDLAKQRLKRGDGPLYEWIAEDRAVALLKLGRVEEALDSVRWGLKRRPKQARLLELRAELKTRGRPRLQLVVDPTRDGSRAR